MDKKLIYGTHFNKCRDLWCPVHHIRFCPLPVDEVQPVSEALYYIAS